MNVFFLVPLIAPFPLTLLQTPTMSALCLILSQLLKFPHPRVYPEHVSLAEPAVEESSHHITASSQIQKTKIRGKRSSSQKSKQSSINNICLYSYDLRSGSSLILLATAEWHLQWQWHFSHLPGSSLQAHYWTTVRLHCCSQCVWKHVCLHFCMCERDSYCTYTHIIPIHTLIYLI